MTTADYKRAYQQGYSDAMREKIKLWREICKKFAECTEICPLYGLCYYKSESEDVRDET